jgi:hypothetical protein
LSWPGVYKGRIEEIAPLESNPLKLGMAVDVRITPAER